jgi:hypothetical protein
MKMKMFATLDKAKPDTENIRSLNFIIVNTTALVLITNQTNSNPSPLSYIFNTH